MDVSGISGTSKTFTFPNESGTLALTSHTHLLSIAATHNQSDIDLAFNSKYLLTAGGNTFVFKMPHYSNASTTEAGLMSAADKTKLNGIESGAEANVNAD